MIVPSTGSRLPPDCPPRRYHPMNVAKYDLLPGAFPLLVWRFDSTHSDDWQRQKSAAAWLH